MALTVNEKRLITSSYELLMKNEVDLANCFYRNLFEMEPLVKPMFSTASNVLKMHFNELIHTAVEQIDYLQDLKETLYELGQKHKQYDIKEGQFNVVKSALLLSMEYELKGKFSIDMKKAWSKYIDMISQVMMQGLFDN